MFRKPSKKKNKAAFRKPGGGPASGSAGAASGSSKFRKRSNSSSEEEEDGNGADADADADAGTSDLLEQIRREKQQQRQGGKSKKRRVGGGGTSDDEEEGGGGGGVMHQFSATGSRLTEKEMATRTAEHHPTAITQGLEKEAEGGGAAAAASANEEANGDGDGKVYQGHNAGQSRNKFLAGPLKAPSFVRTTCRFDYQPDICKDYKDTGFCGFGDTCIYLHDRGDTLSGWQLEAQYEEKKKAEKERKEKEMDRFLARVSGEVGEEDDDDDDAAAAEAANDGLPFACYICRSPFTEPIVTNCQHFFCQACIMKHVRENTPACPICSKDTGGVFNYPAKLISKKKRLVGAKATWEEFAEAAAK